MNWFTRLFRNGREMRLRRLVWIDCMIVGPSSGWYLLLTGAAWKALLHTCARLPEWILKLLIHLLFCRPSLTFTTLTKTLMASRIGWIYRHPAKLMFARDCRRNLPFFAFAKSAQRIRSKQQLRMLVSPNWHCTA